MNRFYSLLALLLVGSASLQAQDTDPFPDFNFRLYSSNVVLTAQVKQNNEVVTDALVAVFCGNEIRGKKRVGEGTDPNVLYMMVYGDYQTKYQYLHFKVYTGGKIFTYNPNPAIDWEDYYNKALGSTSNPYIIDITPVSLANNADNTSTLTTYKDETCDVVLTGRTLYKDGDWNTLVLPFAVSTTSGPLSGDNVTAMVLDGENSGLSGTTLTLNFNAAPEPIPAGTPFIIKWDNTGVNITDPVFTGVTVSDATNDVAFTGGSFKGTYAPMSWNTEDRSILFLGEKNQLHWPLAGAHINACRAYFQLTDPTATVREFNLNFSDGAECGDAIGEGSGETGIVSLSKEPGNKGNNPKFLNSLDYYTLDGRKLDGKPTTKGLYIHNGHKVIVP